LTPALVDSSVLLDIIGGDARWSGWSSTAMAMVGEEADLIINPIIYAEASVKFETIEEVENALAASFLRREDIPYEAAFLAGKAFWRYRQRGGTRRSPLPDLFIGAHAAVAGYRLLTRDARRIRDYFPKLELIAPN
jgi:predicted nucleic acid-binding protein